MCQIIDFRTKRGEYWKRKAFRCAETWRRCAAQVEWLKWSGAPLSEQIRASLDADKAEAECKRIEQSLAQLHSVRA